MDGSSDPDLDVALSLYRHLHIQVPLV